jgi:hypothetical protein
LLIVPKANRQPQAWLILIPLALIAMVWRMPARLVSLPAAETESFGYVVLTGALAWGAVWLMGDWLARRSGVVAFLAALGLLAALGSFSYVLHFGPASGEGVGSLVVYNLSALILVTAMLLARKLSGYRFRPGALLGWQILAIGVAACCVLLVYVAIILAVTAAFANGANRILMFVVQAVFMLTIGTAVWTVLTWLFQLPFMLLVFNSPFYSKRFQSVLGLEERDRPVGPRPLSRPADSPFLAQPAARSVEAGEIVGHWEFYLDELAGTVVIEFRPDGTFARGMVLNDGAVKQFADGTWELDGPAVRVDGLSGVEGKEGTELRTWWLADAPEGPILCGEIGDGRVVRMSRSDWSSRQ